jgi:hypothetical protein
MATAPSLVETMARYCDGQGATKLQPVDPATVAKE